MRAIGIDPGLVHTGCVYLEIDHEKRRLTVRYLVIDSGDHAAQAAEWVDQLTKAKKTPVFIESYRERGQNYGTNTGMRQLLGEFRTHLPSATVLDNMGVKKIVRRPLRQVLGLDSFPTTHHQDLESAARILVMGMLKDEKLNLELTKVLEAHLDGDPYEIH